LMSSSLKSCIQPYWWWFANRKNHLHVPLHQYFVLFDFILTSFRAVNCPSSG